MRMPTSASLSLTAVVLVTGVGFPALAAGAATACQVRVSGVTKTVATDEEVTAAVGRPMTLAHAAVNTVAAPTQVASGPGSDAPGSAATCGWHGTALPTPNLFSQYDAQLEVSIVPYSTVQLAKQTFAAERANAQGTVQAVSGVGDQAFLKLPGGVSSQFDVQAGPYLLSVSTNSGTAAVFASQPWVGLAKVIIGHLVSSNSTNPGPSLPGPSIRLPTPCTPSIGGPAAAAAQELGDRLAWFGEGPPGTTVVDSQLDSAIHAAGFFNALNASQVHVLASSVLLFDVDGQPLYPVVWNGFAQALAACLLTEAFVHALVTTPDDSAVLNNIYRHLAGNPAAAVGLMKPMTADEIFSGLEADQGRAETLDNQYCALGGAALATDVAALLGRGNDISQPQAVALNYLSALGYDDASSSTPGGSGAHEVAGYWDSSGSPLTAAVRTFIQTTLPPLPSTSLKFGTANEWVDAQLPLEGNQVFPAPNDIYGYPLGSPKVAPSLASDYYFEWASQAALLSYLVESPLETLQERAVLNEAASVDLLKTAICDAFADAGAAACFVLDLAALATSYLDPNPQQSVYASGQVVKDLVEASADKLLPPLGLALSIVDPAASGSNPESVTKARLAGGALLCNAESILESTLLTTLHSQHRLLIYAKPEATNVSVADAYTMHTTQVSHPVVTFAYADGSDTQSGPFVMVNDVQALWRSAVHGALEPAQYESCPLGGADPTLAKYQSTLSGNGFAANSLVTVTGHSIPMTLARPRTDAAGRFTAAVDPRPLGVGTHDIVAEGPAGTGGTRQLHWAVTVERNPSHHRSLVSVWIAVGTAIVVLVIAGGVLLLRRRSRSVQAVS